MAQAQLRYCHGRIHRLIFNPSSGPYQVGVSCFPCPTHSGKGVGHITGRRRGPGTAGTNETLDAFLALFADLSRRRWPQLAPSSEGPWWMLTMAPRGYDFCSVFWMSKQEIKWNAFTCYFGIWLNQFERRKKIKLMSNFLIMNKSYHLRSIVVLPS